MVPTELTRLRTIKIEPYPTRTTNLRGKVDTGAQSSILPLRTFRNIFPQHVDSKGLPTTTTPSSTKLTAYNGTPIPQYGTIAFPCGYQSSWSTCEFYIADTPGPVIFGLPTCTALGLVKLNCAVEAETSSSEQMIRSLDDLQRTYPDRFTGIGKFATAQKLTLNADATPVLHPPRRAPVQLRDEIKAELDCMVSLEVIRPVAEPTDWVSSITYVQNRMVLSGSAWIPKISTMP